MINKRLLCYAIFLLVCSYQGYRNIYLPYSNNCDIYYNNVEDLREGCVEKQCDEKEKLLANDNSLHTDCTKTKIRMGNILSGCILYSISLILLGFSTAKTPFTTLEIPNIIITFLIFQLIIYYVS